MISANQLTIDNDDTLTLGAGLSDTVTLSGTVDNCGTIAIGNSTLVIAGGDTLTFDGNGIVTLAGGIIGNDRADLRDADQQRQHHRRLRPDRHR